MTPPGLGANMTASLWSVNIQNKQGGLVQSYDCYLNRSVKTVMWWNLEFLATAPAIFMAFGDLEEQKHKFFSKKTVRLCGCQYWAKTVWSLSVDMGNLGKCTKFSFSNIPNAWIDIPHPINLTNTSQGWMQKHPIRSLVHSFNSSHASVYKQIHMFADWMIRRLLVWNESS